MGGLVRVNDNLLIKDKVPVKLRIFEERYSGGVLDMDIYCFLINSEADNQSVILSQSILNAEALNFSNMKKILAKEAL